jgi:hypothetical protein
MIMVCRRKSRNRRWLNAAVSAAVMLFCLCSGAVQADIIYATGFEPPQFSTGPLLNQDNWLTGAATVQVENAVVSTGTQAVGIVSDASGPQATRETVVLTSLLPLVTLEADVYLPPNPASAAQWDFDAWGGTFNVLGGMNVLADGSVQIVTSGLPTTAPLIPRGAWNRFSVQYNFVSNTFDVFVNGVPIASNQPFLDASNTQFFRAGFFGSSGGNGDVLFFDNYLVTANAVPEPTALAQLAVALAFLVVAGVSRRR